MLLKSLFLIVCSAGVASGVLAMRQQRIQAASDMVRAISRGQEHDRTLWTFRSEIARAASPEEVLVLVSSLGPMIPIPREFCEPATATADARPAPRPRQSTPGSRPGQQARVLRTSSTQTADVIQEPNSEE